MQTFELPPLPFAGNALEPFISAQTISFHYGKHHKTYVDNVNKLKSGTEFEDAGLVDMIMNAQGPLFNNAAQVWNHTFYWNCLAPKSSPQPKNELLEAILAKFGTFENFQKEFTTAALAAFGSGWVWLVDDAGEGLKIVATSNADNPLRNDQDPIMVIDVWEHAYYLDKQNRRADYIADFWKILNWDAISERY